MQHVQFLSCFAFDSEVSAGAPHAALACRVFASGYRVQRLSCFSRTVDTLSNILQISSTHSKCSGFISTDLKHVTVPLVSSNSSKNLIGNSANAKCKFSFAARSKISLDRFEISFTLPARGAKIKISNSGSNAVIHRPFPRSNPYNFSAALRPFSNPAPNSPPRTNGNSLCVAHSATADAPGLEHSKLISPRCKSAA